MTNENVTDLYERVKIGAKVVVLPMGQFHTAQTRSTRNAATELSAASFRTRGLY